MKTIPDLAAKWFQRHPDTLTRSEKRVLEHAAAHRPVARNPNETYEQHLSAGDRLADSMARIGGSWSFIGGFLVFLLVWSVGNLVLANRAFDPYPFIFLNLVLSMLAAVQAPIIMMSQNRQSQHDRIDAAHDYEVNLKAEIEIMALHDKLDQLRNEQLQTILLRIEDLAADIRRIETARLASDRPAPPFNL